MHMVKIDEYIVLGCWHILPALLELSVLRISFGGGSFRRLLGGADFGERILEVEERISKDYQSQRISRSGKVFHLPGPVVI